MSTENHAETTGSASIYQAGQDMTVIHGDQHNTTVHGNQNNTVINGFTGDIGVIGTHITYSTGS